MARAGGSDAARPSVASTAPASSATSASAAPDVGRGQPQRLLGHRVRRCRAAAGSGARPPGTAGPATPRDRRGRRRGSRRARGPARCPCPPAPGRTARRGALATAAHPTRASSAVMPGGQLEAVLEQAVGEQQGVALVGPGRPRAPGRGVLGRRAARPRGPGRQSSGVRSRYDGRTWSVSTIGHEAGLGHRADGAAPGVPGRGVDETVDDRVEKGLPGRLDDVLRDPDGGPDVLAVGGVDEHPGHRPGAPARVEHPHPVVDEMDAGQRREVRPDGLAQRRVEGVDGAVPLGGGHHPGVADPDLHRRLGGVTAVAWPRSVGRGR